jgi:hypothetical protein
VYWATFACVRCGRTEEIPITGTDKEEFASLTSADNIVYGLFVCPDCQPKAAE